MHPATLTIASKITLLPATIRLEVNRRLLANENVSDLARWLNGLPESEATLRAASLEPAITEADLLNWQEGGYRDWVAHQQAMAEVGHVVAEAKELNGAADGALTDHLAAWIAGRYAIATRQSSAKNENGMVDLKLLRSLCHDLVDLRRGDHSAASLRIERERLAMEQAEQKEALEKRFWEWAKENRQKICVDQSLTEEERQRRYRQILGLDDNAEWQNKAVNKVRKKLFGQLPDDPAPKSGRKRNNGSAGDRPAGLGNKDQGGSSSIKVNQAKK